MVLYARIGLYGGMGRLMSNTAHPWDDGIVRYTVGFLQELIVSIARKWDFDRLQLLRIGRGRGTPKSTL
jgi:hypothetical protein